MGRGAQAGRRNCAAGRSSWRTCPAWPIRQFAGARAEILDRLHSRGYYTWWQPIQASEHGVPQLRPRLVLAALREALGRRVRGGRVPSPQRPPTVGEALGDLMAARGWPGADGVGEARRRHRPDVAGGSKKHGGADLGLTRAKAAWAQLGVDGWGVADEPPGPDGREYGLSRSRMDRELGPMLTVRMCARVQGFPDDWGFAGGKTAAYGQIGNAFPLPCARALGLAIRNALQSAARQAA